MIEIVPWRANWREDFLKIGGGLRHALGDLALRIDHIGSTSVPGLAAKDVIDVQVTARALEARIQQAMTSLGYVQIPNRADHAPPGAAQRPSDWAKWFFESPPSERPAHVHVRVEGRLNQRYPLLFRDYLRTHARAAQAYGRVKTALSRLHPADTDAYYAVKDPVCDVIIEAAEAWATSTNWQLGPTDC